MRILIIEDNKELAYEIKDELEKLKFIVDVSNLGLEGEEKAFVNKYDVILLDLNLPDKDGLEILKYLRKNEIDTPIIIVTAKNGIQSLEKGFNLGADDYISKPFELIELRVRIQAVIRRFYGRSNPNIKIKDIEINIGTRKVTVNNKEVVLGVKEFDIFEYMANRYPDVVSSEDIAEHVYDEFFDTTSSVLRVHIARLKKKVNEAGEREIIKTVRGKGYIICED